MSTSEHWIKSPLVPEGAPSRAGRRLLTLREAAQVLGLSPYSVRRLIWAGKLPAVRLTRRIQVDLRDVERLIEQTKDRSGTGV